MRRKKEKKENSERWLLTYSDLITLLMILFVLLYSISNLDLKKFQKLSLSLNQSMGDGLMTGDSNLDGSDGVLDGQTTDSTTDTSDTTLKTDTSTNSDGTTTLTNEAQLEEVKNDINSIIQNTNLEGAVDFTMEQRGLVITFADSIFFDSGKADIKPQMLPSINKIASVLQGFANVIYIEGHTDNIPINNGIFTSNWQLSSVRAANVAQYLAESCGLDPTRLSSVGCGQYKPIASNDTEAGRNQNRRVNFVISYTTAESSTE